MTCWQAMIARSKEQLGSLRFYQKKLNAPTNAAVLLFGKVSIELFPRRVCAIGQVRWSEPTETPIDEHEDHWRSPERDEGSRPTCQGSLRISARSAVRILRTIPSPTIPDVTLHELFINAGNHRNYDGSTTPVSINHFLRSHRNPESWLTLRRPYEGPVSWTARPIEIRSWQRRLRRLGFANRFGRGIALAERH